MDSSPVVCFNLLQTWSVLDEDEKKELSLDPEFVQCLILLRIFTTTPPWFDYIEPYTIPSPRSYKADAKHYQQLIDDGWGAMFVYDGLRYRSGRPVTDISIITKPGEKRHWHDLSRAVPYRPLHPYLANFTNGLHVSPLLLPIVRYEAGMSRGLYYETAEGEFCGTYFYFEPDSGFYLESDTTYVASNKISAAIQLGLSVEKLYRDEAESWGRGRADPLAAYLAEFGYHDRKLTAEELLVRIIHESLLIDDKNYRTAAHPHYAFEDVLDQPLCMVGREMGVDCFLFKYCSTRTRVVSEVLDNRPRDICYNHIYYPPMLPS
jgi:hypothetical protein